MGWKMGRGGDSTRELKLKERVSGWEFTWLAVDERGGGTVKEKRRRTTPELKFVSCVF